MQIKNEYELREAKLAIDTGGSLYGSFEDLIDSVYFWMSQYSYSNTRRKFANGGNYIKKPCGRLVEIRIPLKMKWQDMQCNFFSFNKEDSLQIGKKSPNTQDVLLECRLGFLPDNVIPMKEDLIWGHSREEILESKKSGKSLWPK